MNRRIHSMIPASALLVAFLMSAASATGMAQTTKPSPVKMPRHQEGMKDRQGMKGMQGMSGMTGGPHHALAMAYRDNLATFAKALRAEVTETKVVNLEFARPALAEMKRSLEQLTQHHRAQMAKMGDQTPPMSEVMLRTESHLTTLGKHLAALESELNGNPPNAKEVAAHATEILKECAGMSQMHAQAKPHQVK